jgi:hypothetical protein
MAALAVSGHLAGFKGQCVGYSATGWDFRLLG